MRQHDLQRSQSQRLRTDDELTELEGDEGDEDCEDQLHGHGDLDDDDAASTYSASATSLSRKRVFLSTPAGECFVCNITLRGMHDASSVEQYIVNECIEVLGVEPHAIEYLSGGGNALPLKANVSMRALEQATAFRLFS